VDGLSIQVMASNLSALNRSLAEGVTRRSTVDDSANILAGRAHFQQVAFVRQRLTLIQGWQQGRAVTLVGLRCRQSSE
jgi:hypothetical protein